MSSKILVLPGDGIGFEVADQAIRVIDKLNELGLDATYEKELVGGASYKMHHLLILFHKLHPSLAH